jgi:hypothetical protein
VPPVSPEQFAEILRRVIAAEGVQGSDADVQAVTDYLFESAPESVSGSLARDLVWILIDNARHEGHEPLLTVPAIDLAYRQFTGAAGRRLANGQAAKKAPDG